MSFRGKMRVAFVMNKVKFKEDEKDEEKNEEKKVDNETNDGKPKPKKGENEKIQKLMNQKLFSSVTESEEYKIMIKK